jgi:hypothetical protein
VQRIALGPASRTRSAGGGLRYERRIRLRVRDSAPLVVAVDGTKELRPVIARGGVLPFAFTNPIWLVRPDPDAPPAQAPSMQVDPTP